MSIDEFLKSESPVVVVFSASWCNPCKTLSNIISEIISDHEEWSDRFYKVDTDEEFELVQEYDIMSVPTVLFINNGELVERASGVQSRAKLEEWLTNGFFKVDKAVVQ